MKNLRGPLGELRHHRRALLTCPTLVTELCFLALLTVLVTGTVLVVFATRNVSHQFLNLSKIGQVREQEPLSQRRIANMRNMLSYEHDIKNNFSDLIPLQVIALLPDCDLNPMMIPCISRRRNQTFDVVTCCFSHIIRSSKTLITFDATPPADLTNKLLEVLILTRIELEHHP